MLECHCAEKCDPSPRKANIQETMEKMEQSQKTPPHVGKKPFTTYVHNVTEVRQSRKNYSYFNFQLQAQCIELK